MPHTPPQSSHRLLRCRIISLSSEELWVNADDIHRRIALTAEHEYLYTSVWLGATLLLIDPEIQDDALTAEVIILHPDYLVDISSIAACFKEYGAHPLHYLYHLITPQASTAYTLLGNTVNRFFDDRVQGIDDYTESLQQSFHEEALNYLTTDDLGSIYFPNLERHYQNIRTTVTQAFPRESIDREHSILEPSFICPTLGLQGRMDLLSLDDAGQGSARSAALIELKSGKWDEYRHTHRITHYVQMLLYAELLHHNQGIPREDIRPYLLYSTYPELVAERWDTPLIHRALKLRNEIVGYLHLIAEGRGEALFSERSLEEIQSTSPLWERFERPRLVRLLQPLDEASPKMRRWFFDQLRFIVAEDELSRLGMPGATETGERGASGLWLNSYRQKCTDGEIIAPLTLELPDDERCAHISELHFRIATWGETAETSEEAIPIGSPNFRIGDDVVLYAGDARRVDATERLILRGNLAAFTPEHLQIVLREPLSRQVLETLHHEFFACEHDVINSTMVPQCRALYRMISAPERWHRLLIEGEAPQCPPAPTADVSDRTAYTDELIQRMLATQDYFLLVGPPGTGKTSYVLRRLMEALYGERKEHVLLLSYTHRAVDENCRTLQEIEGLDYLRFGHALHCAPEFQDHLLRHRTASCRSRREMQEVLERCRVYVGTTASVQMQPALFRLKQFDTIIVDEASQLLEFQLIELLTHARRFFLIGDHKQLPAVTRQQNGASLFERLILQVQSVAPGAAGTLLYQGRMHPDIARFANNMFYNGKLRPIPLPHQLEQWSGAETPTERFSAVQLQADDWAQICTRRYAFVDVPYPTERGRKYHPGEAAVVARLAHGIVERYKSGNIETSDGFCAKTLGIIVPFRSQIAAIRQELIALGLSDEVPLIDIDTVERYQGSQRDVIIYSATVSTEAQLARISVCQEIEGQWVDRKLNVILTRARKQMFLVGNAALLCRSVVYNTLLQ